jgi:hypothetical protein
MSGATIVWFRQDLRLRDNSALHAAAARGGAVIPVYIWCPEEEGHWAPGASSKWWLHHSLHALDESLRARGSRLVLAIGPALEALRALAKSTSAGAVFWNRRYEPAAVACSSRVKAELTRDGLRASSFNSALLSEPAELVNQSGKPYQVYGAFLRSLLSTLDPPAVLPMPRDLPAPTQWPKSVSLEALGLLPKTEWTQTMAATWRPGETGAQSRLKRCLAVALKDYRTAREVPAIRGTATSFSAHGRRAAASGVSELSLETQCAVSRCVAEGTHRNSPGRCGYARAMGDRMDAQSCADGDGILAGQESAGAVARGRALVLGHAGGCRSRKQHAQLAMGRGLRCGRGAVFSDLQPDHAGEAVRP